MEHDLAFEAAYWGDCTNTFDEQQKHFVYGPLMGIKLHGYTFDAGNQAILDIGGGPASMLLMCTNLGAASAVTDPLMDAYPQWVRDRYACKKIATVADSGEDIRWSSREFDEVWIYNVLQHVEDPAKVIANARAAAPVLRLFEWIDIPPHEGHPHMLTRELLDKWTGRRGAVTKLAERGCYGTAYTVVVR